MGYEKTFKPHTHFSHAFQDWTGSKWDWEIDGKRNDPMDSSDPEIMAFYLGFQYAKRGQVKLKQLENSIKLQERNLAELKKSIKRFRKEL